MLHELLMALMGQPGAIIKRYNQTFAVDPSVTLLSQPEANMISEIAQTGYYYQQLAAFIKNEKAELSFADIRKDPSIYRKAIAQGLQKAIKEYQQLILSIQRDFLNNRHFTFSNIRAELTKYQIIMKQLWTIIQKIVTEKYKGGVIIDMFWQAFQKSNTWLKSWTHIILKECQQVFLNQVIAWIAHGQLIDVEDEFFIHKVLHEPQEKIQFSKINTVNIEMTGWDIYTLNSELIPSSIVSPQTAGKILFIGKSVKILRSSGKISSIPSKSILNDIRQIFKADYCQIQFQSTIEKIRKAIAEQMIKLIIGEQNLMRELQKINEYYFMLKGDFYHHFLEESRIIEHINNKEKAQKKINETCLQNTFIRLNNIEDSKRVSFQIKALGFSYIGFKNFVNICPVGNIDLVEGKYIRFTSSEGGIWHRTKQIVQNNFTILYSLSFKKTKSIFKTRRQDFKQRKSNIISLVIQNQREISPSLHQNPCSLSRINEYLAINIGYRYSQIQKNYESVIIITYKNEKKFSNPVQIGKLQLKKINFLDERVFFVKVAYQNDELKVSVNPINSYDAAQEFIKFDQIRMSSYLNLEMSRAFIGVLSNIEDLDCQAQVQQWQMLCKPTNYYGDHWSDLSLSLKISWPLNLILTADLMQIFSRINKFLFPIRQIQIQLQKIWLRIPRRFKQARLQRKNPLSPRELAIFQRKVSVTRSRMNMVVNNLWSYFQSDVVKTIWLKLRENIAQSDDFQDVIRMVNKYVNTIQAMFYFNALKIQRSIHEIIRQSRNFVAFFNKIQNEHIDSKTVKEYENIDEIFCKNVLDFHKMLKELSKTSNSAHFFHLTQRIEGCVGHDNKYLYY